MPIFSGQICRLMCVITLSLRNSYSSSKIYGLVLFLINDNAPKKGLCYLTFDAIHDPTFPVIFV